MGVAENLSSLGLEIKAKSDQILKLATEKPTVEDLTDLVYELRSKNKVWVTGLDELKALEEFLFYSPDWKPQIYAVTTQANQLEMERIGTKIHQSLGLKVDLF